MSMLLSRRRLLATALATGALPLLSNAARASAPPKRLIAGTRTLEVNGRAARVFALTGPDGRPGLRLAPGQQFRIELANRTGTRTLVHWHGQLPPWTQDGFPWRQTPPIADGVVQTYDYAPVAGTYWMHSHYEMQEQNLMTAPLIVHTEAELREDRQEVVLMLHDFTFRTPEEVLARLTGEGGGGAPQVTARKREEMSPGVDNSKMAGGRTASTSTGMPGMSSMAEMTASKAGGMHMDLNDVQYDAFLANDRTLADPEIVRVDRGGRIRLRIINGASSSQFWIDLGELTGRVVATDGRPVREVTGGRFPLAMAQRLDILIDLPAAGAFPILAQLEGGREQAGIILATAGAPVVKVADRTQTAPPVDHSLESRLEAIDPLRERLADIARTITLGGGMKPYAWSMNGEYWPRVTPLMLAKGQRVEIELVNQTMMAHPMHLHGHVFQVIAIDERPIRGAMRDTILVMPKGRVRIAFDADNPGRWAFHCHNLYHMISGMMTEFRYEGITA